MATAISCARARPSRSTSLSQPTDKPHAQSGRWPDTVAPGGRSLYLTVVDSDKGCVRGDALTIRKLKEWKTMSGGRVTPLLQTGRVHRQARWALRCRVFHTSLPDRWTAHFSCRPATRHGGIFSSGSSRRRCWETLWAGSLSWPPSTTDRPLRRSKGGSRRVYFAGPRSAGEPWVKRAAFPEGAVRDLLPRLGLKGRCRWVGKHVFCSPCVL